MGVFLSKISFLPAFYSRICPFLTQGSNTTITFQPFSSGRRSCMGYKVVESVVVSLLVLMQSLKMLLKTSKFSSSFPPTGRHHRQLWVLLPILLPGPPGWHACSSRVSEKSVNYIFKNTSNSHFLSSAPLSYSLSLGLRKGEPLLAELKSYLLLFRNLFKFNKGDGLGKLFFIHNLFQ